ncbi:centrosomal protein of 126 kDa isoform X2 [Elephas maximus indicus]|uniref:centrosomal protein of 126 kDa isoform X2 n=1 Tax=Elephas maximus indicus TaxID=99487 RepID=UPI002115F6F4|nr:centrosomal protein of 126 kDa isoform X2 [Elephas maximus indicus]
MLAGRPGAQSAVADLGAESSDTRTRAPLRPRDSSGRHRLGANLDMKIHLEKNLEEERQILLQQQKICRNRARKYFVESNRRKKAFEEKRKEQEEREHQLREQILQQRKQKFEEVTERFQRAHIPLSQRKRAVFKKTVPPLEEALKQIQGSNLKSELNLPTSHRPIINWRAIDSALPSALSNRDQKHQTHLSSKVGCDKEMKENSRANLATNKDAFRLKLEETQKLLEDQHLSSLQKFRDEVNQITNSETLSSIDSLEAGECEEIYLTLTKDRSTSTQQNSISLKSANLQSTNLNCFDEDKLSFSKTQHINNWLINLDDPNTQTATPFSDILSKPNVLPSCERLNSKEQNSPILSTTMERTTNTANNSVAFVHSPHVFVQNTKNEKTSATSTVGATEDSSEAFKMERPFVTESPAFQFSKAWTTPDPLTREVATFLDQEEYSKLTQQNAATSIHTPFVPVATPLVLVSNAQSARPLLDSIHIKEIDPVQCSDKLDELKDVKDEKMHYFNNNKKELPLFSDDPQAACMPHNPDSKDKTQKIAETSSNVISNYDVVGHHKKMKYNIHERNGVRFLKSILKKESKYDHHYFKALIMNQDCKFGNKKAAAIRDSIELTKEKGKGAEIPKTIKKLRWLDETGNIENNADENHSLKNRTGIAEQWSQQFHTQTQSSAASNIISVPASAVNSADAEKPKDDSVSESVAVGGSERDPVPLNCFFVPSGYNFAKQAWLASKKEGIKSPAHNGDSQTQKANPQRDGTNVIRRAKPAKAPSASIHTNRKGTIITPHSASKAKTCIQTQGKLIVPHPPPKSTSNMSGKNIKVSQCQPVMPENPENIITHNCFNSKYVLPLEYHCNQWTQESSSPLPDASSDLVTVIPSLPSYCTSEGQTLTKINHSDGTQMVAQQDGTLYCTQRGPVYEESHHGVTLKTTGEESIPLWKRGHNVLGQNARAADSTVTRRKRIVENKRRGLLEQKRQNPGYLGQKHSEQYHNFEQNVQISSSEPKQATRGMSNIEEVSDSTSEFLMAENLVKASVPEDEVLTVLNSKLLQKPNLALNKTQRFNICTLSAEEQKILQSLSLLNERLYYVQETACKNPSIKNILQIIPLLVVNESSFNPAATFFFL